VGSGERDGCVLDEGWVTGWGCASEAWSVKCEAGVGGVVVARRGGAWRDNVCAGGV
jgi:hypothetical protein